uniref:Uncharacterized protein n=1 Tax=Aegilops tauschii subsp. strangulata TaxID=200361 RepID=A0A453BYV5_AEGTS
VVSHVFSSQPTKARNRVQRGGGEGGKKMESESGMGTEGESGKGQDLLLDLGRKLGKMEIELGKWTEQASGKEQETVRDLKKRHRKLSKNRRYLLQDIVSGKFKELYSDSGRNRVMGIFREAEELDKELMIIKEKEKEKQETVVDSGEEEMGRDSARHQSLMEGQLRKEQERLRKVRYQLKKKMRSESDKDPAMQRMLLSQQQILWTKEQALLTVMRQSGMGMGMGMEMEMEMEMEMDSDSDSDSGSGSGSGSGHEMDERDSSKEPVRDAGGKEGQMANDLVGVLSGHLGMLKREISFLRTEVKSRGLAGNRACQEQIMSNLRPLDENLLKKVNLPYLGSNTEEVMDFLLVETQQLLYRFNSLASILQKLRIPISSDKIDKLRLISNALVGISELIKRHKSVAADKQDGEDRLDCAGWEATWGSSTGRHGCFDDISKQ